jgi:outer membrane receptor protein involved in Fe transport
MRRVTFQAGYRYADATVTSFPANLALVGLDVPQVPRHVFTFAARYNSPAWILAVQGRASSRQFEDDQNLLPLDSYFTLDTFLQRRIVRGLYGIAAIENVLDQQYMVGRTPLPTLGPPLLFRLGVRVHLGE